MKTFGKITITKPCQENWETMTPTTQGRFCNLCAKNVIDFSVMSSQEIQNYSITHASEETCGKFRKEQLSSIIIEIPDQLIAQNQDFKRTFLLALLIVMGTTLFSCKTPTDLKAPIDKVIITATDSISDTTSLNTKEKINTITIDSILTAELSVDSVYDTLGFTQIIPLNLDNIPSITTKEESLNKFLKEQEAEMQKIKKDTQNSTNHTKD